MLSKNKISPDYQKILYRNRTIHQIFNGLDGGVLSLVIKFTSLSRALFVN